MNREEIKQEITNKILDGPLSWAFDNEVREGENSYFNMIDGANEVAEDILVFLEREIGIYKEDYAVYAINDPNASWNNPK